MEMHGTQRISRSLQYTTKVAFSSRPFSRLQAASAFLFAVRQPSDSEASRQVKRGVGIGSVGGALFLKSVHLTETARPFRACIALQC